MSFLLQHAEDRAKGKVRRKRGGSKPPMNHARVLPPGMTVADLEAECARVGLGHRRTYYARRAAGLSHAEALSLPSQRGRALPESRSGNADQSVINAALRAWR